MSTATFTTDAFDGKIEYRFANQNYSKKTVTMIADVFLKRRTQDKNIIGSKARIYLTFDSISSYAVNDEYIGIPYDKNYHKVGTIIREGVTAGRTVSAKVNGRSSFSDFQFVDVGVTLTVPKTEEEKRVPSTFSIDRNSVNLGEDIRITVDKKSGETSFFHKILFSWGNIQRSEDYFSRIDNGENPNDSDDGYFGGIVTTILGIQAMDTKNLKLNLPISLVNNLQSRESDICVIELVTYERSTLGLVFDEIKSIQRKEVTVKIPENYKPVVGLTSIKTINENEVISGWGNNITLQRYSKAKATMTADNVKTDDNAVVKCSIACSTGENSDSGTLETGVFSQHGEKTFIFTATDSRGRTSQTTQNLNVEKYDDPSITITSLKRMSRNDDETYYEADDGNFFELKTIQQCSSCGDKNSVSCTVQYKTASGERYSVAENLEEGTNIIEIAEAYQGDETLKVKVNVVDALGNTNFVEGTLPGTSILVHITNKGKSIGVNCYNFLMNSIKFGLDVYIGEDKLEDFVKSQMGDFVVSSGEADATVIQFNHTPSGGTKTPYEFDTSSWKYKIWNSGEIELWTDCSITSLKPNQEGGMQQNLYISAPTLFKDKKINETNFKMIESVVDCNEPCTLVKSSASGFSGNSFVTTFRKDTTWDTLDVRMDFHFILIPKE